MVTGREARDCDKTPIPVNGGEITSVREFAYLGYMIAAYGRMHVENCGSISSFRCPPESCLPGRESEAGNQEDDLPGLRTLCLDVRL